MTQPAKHTPWHTSKENALIIYGEDRRAVAMASFHETITVTKAEANAALIVKAVNSHAKLSEACKLIAAGGGDIDLLTAQEVARAAIAEAEGVA